MPTLAGQRPGHPGGKRPSKNALSAGRFHRNVPRSARADFTTGEALVQRLVDTDVAVALEEIERVLDFGGVVALVAVGDLLVLEGAGDAHVLLQAHEVGALVAREVLEHVLAE